MTKPDAQAQTRGFTKEQLDAALAWLRDELNVYMEGWENAARLARLIARREQAAAESAKPPWIPCSERMPDDESTKDGVRGDESRVLFVTVHGQKFLGFWVTDSDAGPEWESWEQDDAFDCPRRFKPEEVVAWMPLPEGP